MSPRIRRQREIDSALRALGSAQPPEGMERRVHARLQTPARKFPAVYSISAAAMALGILIVAAAFNPTGRSRTQRDEAPLQTSNPQPNDRNLEQRILTRPESAFGAASAIHIPNRPVAVEPAPVGLRRGHTRSVRESQPPAGAASTASSKDPQVKATEAKQSKAGIAAPPPAPTH